MLVITSKNENLAFSELSAPKTAPVKPQTPPVKPEPAHPTISPAVPAKPIERPKPAPPPHIPLTCPVRRD
jgi:hypothetical protein